MKPINRKNWILNLIAYQVEERSIDIMKERIVGYKT